MTYVCGADRSGIYTVSGKSTENAVDFIHMIHAPAVDDIDVIFILSVCQRQKLRKHNCLCFYDPSFHHGGVSSIICTVSAEKKKQM